MSRVLVVDDRVLNREFLATLLRYVGHDVIEAADGAEALERVRRERPDLVISDVLMPVMDGVQFAHAVHADAAIASTPIIFYTATYRLDTARQMAADCGVGTVLGKPAEPQAIIDAVQAALAGSASVAPAPALRASEADGLPRYLHDLVGLQRRLQDALGESLQLMADGGPLRRSSDRLLLAYSTVQGLSLRLAAVLEFGVELAQQREPQQLLQLLCGAAQNVVDARLAAVCIDVDSHRPWRFASRGLPAGEAAAVQAALQPQAGLLGQVIAEGRPQRINREVPTAESGLPEAFPALASLLLVPLASSSGITGWLLLGNRLGGPFSEDDQQFAVTLAAQFAPACESLMLYDEVQQYAAQLEAEIVERKFALARLSESELRFRQLAETINEVFFLVAPARRQLLYLSPAYARIWGRSRADLYARLDGWLDDVHPDDRVRAEREVLLAEPAGTFDSEFRILRPDGALRWVRVRGYPVQGPDGALQRIAGTAEDITERREHEQGIARLTRIRAVLSGINSAILRLRDRQELLQEACRIAVEEGAFRRAWISVVDAEGVPQVAASRRRSRPGVAVADTAVGTAPGEIRLARQALQQHAPALCNDTTAQSAAFVGDADGCRSVAAFPLLVETLPAAVLLLAADEPGFFDEQELHLLRELAGDIGFGLQYIAKEEGLDYLACYDALTGLARGTLFLDRLNQLLGTARSSGERLGVVVLDLERFTRINDNFGRQLGDHLLQAVAERLGAVLSEPCSLARIGADTFALALGGLVSRNDLARDLDRSILPAIEQPFRIDGIDLQLTAHAGVALFPGDGDDADGLFKNAEAALKQAQAAGERFLFYARHMNAEVSARLALEAGLRHALERGQFELHYQPKLDGEPGRIVGFEALARWAHPERGLVHPAEFIPVLEETGMILELGDWALRQALADHRHWSEAGLRAPRIAVNVSARQLHRADFAERVLAAIHDSGVGADALELEITESLIMQDIDTGIRSLRRLRDAGVCISIDDFGTGYSSLRYLALLPLDTLKIDRSFVITMLDDPSSMAIVSMVISLAHTLKLAVVAEGVDDPAQARALKRLGCNEMQGFLFSEPLAAGAAGRLLAVECGRAAG